MNISNHCNLKTDLMKSLVFSKLFLLIALFITGFSQINVCANDRADAYNNANSNVHANNNVDTNSNVNINYNVHANYKHDSNSYTQTNEKKYKEQLDALDREIVIRSSYENIKRSHIHRLQKQLLSTHQEDSTYYRIHSDLFKLYRSYKSDSAYYFANKMLEYAQKLNQKDWIVDSKISLAFSCMSAGLFKEANELSESIEIESLSKAALTKLYLFRFTLNIDMANYSGTEPFQSRYKQQALLYYQRLKTLNPPKCNELLIANIQWYQLNGQFQQATHLAQKTLREERLDERTHAIISSILGFCLLMEHQDEQAIVYLASAAISDLKSATKETSAIRQLAELLYLKKDLTRAYTYSRLALSDANFYNSRFRKIEIGHILPIIETERFNIIKQQKNELILFTVVSSMLGLMFMVATVIILRQKKKLKADQAIISKQNSELLASNRKIKDSDRIKDEYIGYFFTTNAKHLEKLEEFQRLVIKHIKNRKFEELIQLADSEELEKERKDLFSLFDQIFLRLFPNFIAHYNTLFLEKDQIHLPGDQTLLPPEVRIFALIRLGITGNESIAKFLHLSVSTVKNYKTKVKNKSIVSNELFEENIMGIEGE